MSIDVVGPVLWVTEIVPGVNVLCCVGDGFEGGLSAPLVLLWSSAVLCD